MYIRTYVSISVLFSFAFLSIVCTYVRAYVCKSSLVMYCVYVCTSCTYCKYIHTTYVCISLFCTGLDKAQCLPCVHHVLQPGREGPPSVQTEEVEVHRTG